MVSNSSPGKGSSAKLHSVSICILEGLKQNFEHFLPTNIFGKGTHLGINKIKIAYIDLCSIPMPKKLGNKSSYFFFYN